ncbi:MAG: hypothetical protein ACLGI2_04325 [Acidimicrobiia bacterium]
MLETDGVTGTDARRAAADGSGDVPAAWAPFLHKVRTESYRVTDADVTALRAAGHTEEEIFELTVAAALGAAFERLESGLRAVRGPS